MILIFFGPPGAGKGTQAKFISSKFNIPHLSTGDILREELKNQSELSENLKNIIDSGQLVSDQILNDIVGNRIIKKDCDNGFILDGYPRTIKQSQFIEKFFDKKHIKIHYVFEFYLDEELIIGRILSRAQKESRGDDSADIIRTRIQKYYEDTKPVIEHYKNAYSLIYQKINGNQEIKKLNSKLLDFLEKTSV